VIQAVIAYLHTREPRDWDETESSSIPRSRTPPATRLKKEAETAAPAIG